MALLLPQRVVNLLLLWSRSDGCAERFNGAGDGARKGREGTLNGLTLMPSLRAAEMCDLAASSKPVKRIS